MGSGSINVNIALKDENATISRVVVTVNNEQVTINGVVGNTYTSADGVSEVKILNASSQNINSSSIEIT